MATKSNKTKVCDLRIGDVIKVQATVRIDHLKTVSTTLGGMNEASTLKSLDLTMSEGPFKGTKAQAVASEDDKFEVIKRDRRSIRARVKAWYKRWFTWKN